MPHILKRDVHVHIRMTAAERESLKKLSDLLGLSPSALLRRSFPAYATDLLNRRKRRDASHRGVA